MDNLNKSLGKVSIGVPPVPPILTFVPMVWKLPSENIVTEENRSGILTEKPHKNSAVSLEERTRDVMSDRQTSKAETAFIKESAERGAGSTSQPRTEVQLKSDHMSLSWGGASPLPVSAPSENTSGDMASIGSMETAVDKQQQQPQGISQQQQQQQQQQQRRWCRDASGPCEVSSGFSQSRASEDLFPTPASSRESILSEGSDMDRSWSAMMLSSFTSPASFSRTVSPCSSTRSGAFTPSVVQVRRHFLEPGSSLLQTPQTCMSSRDSLSSPPPPARRRPPLTRLSLLTAILRKGRLPVLSSALRRPYTPCWPVNPVTLSFCNACSAASSVASIPLEFCSSRCSSSASIDSQSHLVHHHREPNEGVTSPLPPVQSDELSRSRAQAKRGSEQIRPRWEQVISPLAMEDCTLPQAPPQPRFCSNFQSHSHKSVDCAAPKDLQHTHFTESPEPKPSITQHTYLKGNTENSLPKPISLSPELIYEQETSSVPQKWSVPLPHSSLSRLHTLSPQPRSQPQPYQSRAAATTRTADTASPLTPSHSPAGGWSCPDSKNATRSDALLQAHCLLSPSRYTPMVFPGWPSPSSTPTPTPSPAPPLRDFTPSPCFTPRSTPSPRPGSAVSDYSSDREGKKRKTHKIKLSYKSLAAIPTNTLLLDQQAIDEQVESGESLCDTHAEMRSPAQLRQQSEELYAAIDEILASSSPEPPRSKSANPGVQQNHSSQSKTLGRETKYASLSSLVPSTGVERKLMDANKKTRPGVIRPMTAIPRLTVEDEEEFHPNPFRHFNVKHTLNDNTKLENKSFEDAAKDLNTISKGQMSHGRRTPFSVCDLQITEPQDLLSHQVKEASTPFSRTEGRMNTYETHI